MLLAESMNYLKIWLLSVGAAILYGILHDQFTTRICIEYFTIAHPPIFDHTENPTLLAFGWGTIATWWVGLGLGVPLSLVARIGSRPKLGVPELWRPIGLLLGCMAVVSVVAGLIGWRLAATRAAPTPSPWSALIPEERRVAFMAVAWAHAAAYQAGFLGGLALWIWAWITRWRLARNAVQGKSNAS